MRYPLGVPGSGDLHVDGNPPSAPAYGISIQQLTEEAKSRASSRNCRCHRTELNNNSKAQVTGWSSLLWRRCIYLYCNVSKLQGLFQQSDILRSTLYPTVIGRARSPNTLVPSDCLHIGLSYITFARIYQDPPRMTRNTRDT